ncbi:MAG TPA: hypothetical protein VMF69_15950 [Gemmataceae bacterium]|nr:hypothetical protein [Gemmataceae bacterium]
MRHTARAACAVVVLLSAWATTHVRAGEDPWADFRFLIGSWISDGRPEEGTGSFTLEPDLGGKILIRRNLANLPAAKGRPAAKHEDLMIVYRVPGGQTFQASYFDNEGHIIQYSVRSLPDKKGLVFLSTLEKSLPRFRLTYTKSNADKVAVKFEIAPPNKADAFKTYLEGTVRRKKGNERTNAG